MSGRRGDPEDAACRPLPASCRPRNGLMPVLDQLDPRARPVSSDGGSRVGQVSVSCQPHVSPVPVPCQSASVLLLSTQLRQVNRVSARRGQDTLHRVGTDCSRLSQPDRVVGPLDLDRHI